MGRLLKEILNLTDPRKTIYLESTLSFYDANNGSEVFTLKTFGLLFNCIGITGLNGLDKLLGHMISREMRLINIYIL